MNKLTSRIMIAVGIVVATLVVLAITGRKSVHSEIDTAASPEAVWQVLMDKEAYHEWNPVLIPVEGTLKEGEKVSYEFHQDANTSSVISSKVIKLEENRLLNQGGGVPGVITFNHSYTLVPTANGTKVIIHEDYRGIYVHFWNPQPVEVAYKRLNEALKKRVESVD